jgi:prepilin peptidase CpaA
MVYVSILQIPLLLYVAITDVAIRTISNKLCVAIAVIGIISRSANPLQLAESLGVAVMLFLALLTMHSRGWVGGGDVKLLAALTIGLSLTQLMQLLTVMALAGVGLAMAHMILRSLSSPALAPIGSSIVRRVYAVERWRNLRHAPLPYGVAIACGGIWTLLGNGI